ncbi:hypothetical protein HH214_00140 [Mucilaginibacter robiniae]|uniref:Uncharacterized protein n=1 Tax=Mucilaginibacter robiniae TaxID=2728022 RepID=A0A7L5DUK8_9SPHI|nr:hypothetical protein [Mucilaginibacter robiniae]QJD94391.1 hypothetical protein HH214_00140 [Mucilaginibacter robiniae]
MKTKLILFLALALAACKSRQPASNGCNVICTKQFVIIPVKLISTAGHEVDYKSYHVIETATGKEIKSRNELPVTDRSNANIVLLVDDSHLHDFVEKGTNVQLQITRKDDKVLKVNYKISGGKCACHVAKLDGPDEVDIDQQL